MAFVLCRRQERVLDWLTRLLAAVGFALALRYVIWRWSRIIATSYWLSLPFVICEGCLILLGSGAFYLQISFYQRRKTARLHALGINPDRWPSVDVMVPCYREPIEVIERTVTATLAIDWPADRLTVMLLDDGGSQEASAMVDRLSAQLRKAQSNPELRPTLRYVARLRKPHEPHHAKAGNLNHALFKASTAGDYVLVLDCDMVPKPGILQALMPHFFDVHRALDARVAMVQSPQAFSNIAPGDPLNNTSPLFYHVLLPGWDALDAAPCCGTNVVFRRQALATIGGFTYGSVTEDFLTSLTLQAAGFQTRYVDEVLAEGLAPDELDAFFAQRLRWAVGGLQIFRYFNPLCMAGLSWPQRLLYAWSGGHYLLSFPLAIVLCTPFIFLLDSGRLLLTTGTVREYMGHFLPYYLVHTCVSLLSHRRLGWAGLRYFWRAQQEPVYLAFTFMKACLIVGLGLQFGFQVTRKDGRRDDVLADLAHALPHAVLLLVGWACVVTGALQMAGASMGGDLFVAYAINMGWATLVLLGLWVPIGQFLAIPVPCWCVDARAWCRGCWAKVGGADDRRGYEPVGDGEEKWSGKDLEAARDDGGEEGKRDQDGGEDLAPAPANQPGSQEEGNNEQQPRLRSPPASEGTPLLTGRA